MRFFAVRGDVEAFGAAAHRYDGFFPVRLRSASWSAGAWSWPAGAWSRAASSAARRRRTSRSPAAAGCLLTDRHGRGTDIRRDDAVQIGCDVKHMSAVLPRAEDEIDLLRCRVEAAEGFGCFRREPQFSAGELEPVRPAKRSQIDRRERFLPGEIDDADGIVRAASVIGDVGGIAVGRGDHFVRIGSRGRFEEDFQRCRIDRREGLIGFRERQQKRSGRWQNRQRPMPPEKSARASS